MNRQQLLSDIEAQFSTTDPMLVNLYAKSKEFAIWMLKYLPDNPQRYRAFNQLGNLVTIAADSILAGKVEQVEINEDAIQETVRNQSESAGNQTTGVIGASKPDSSPGRRSRR